MSEGRGVRQSIYIKNKEAIDAVTDEEHEKLNGTLIESMFWDTHLGKEKNIQEIVKGMYRGEYDLQEAMVRVLQYFLSNEKFDLQEVRFFIKIIKTACENSKWSDDSPSDRKKALQPLDDALKLKEAEFAYSFHNGEKSFDPDKLKKSRNRLSANQGGEEYPEKWLDKHVVAIADFQENFKELTSSKDTTPADVLDFVFNAWEEIDYNYSRTYAAIAYCVRYSSDVVDTPHLRQRFRRFCLYFSDFVCAEDSKKMLDGV